MGAALPAEEGVEGALAAAAPNALPLPISTEIEAYAVDRGWTRLHGATVAIAYPPVVAYEKQLVIEKDGVRVSGLGEIASRVPQTVTVDIAGHTGEGRLVELAARLCAKDTQLVRGLNLQSPSGRSIFAKALDLNDGVWVGLEDATRTVSQLIRLSASGEAIEPTIWLHIARSPFGDLSKEPERALMWERLPKDVVQHLLPSTARGWIAAALASPTSAVTPEPALATSVVSELNRSELLHGIPADQAHPFVMLFALLPLQEAVLFEWLNSYQQSLAPGDAMEIGRLIAARRWSTCAKSVASRVLRGVRDLIPTLRQCESLLGFWDRMELRIKGTLEQHPFSPEELWDAFLDLAITLYPSGPDERHVWERAGGDVASLEFHGNGRDRWHRAIHRVRNGDRVTAPDLVGVMREDYPQNSVLYWLGRQDLFKR